MARSKLISGVRHHLPLLIVLALIIAYSAYFSAYSIQRHNTFRTYASDMGQMDQALWNTLHGHWLEDTRDLGDGTARQAPRLTDHVEPIFFVVPFVFLLYSGIESLFVLQSNVIALAALPLYWIARRRLKNDWLAVVFAAIYLLFPALQAANLAEFHAVTLAPAPLMFAYNYGQERAWKRYVFFSLIALAVKEDIALLVLTMALSFAFQSSKDSQQSPDKYLTFHVFRFTFHVRVLPLIVALFSLAWFAITLLVIIPHFSPAGRSVYTERYYPGLSADPTKLLMAVPRIVVGIFIPEKLGYLLQLFASVGFLALFDPVALLIGAPAWGLNLLSNYPAMYSGTYHYSAPVAPYFVLAAIGGASWLSDFLIRRFRNSQFLIRHSQLATRNLPALVIVPAFIIALGYQAMAGYTPFSGEYFWPEVTPHQRLLARFLAQIPDDVPVSTMRTLFTHVSHRRAVYRFPTIQDADYVLLDVSQANTTNPIDYVMNYRNLLKQGFGIRDALDGYILLQRGGAQKELPDGFYNFLRTCPCVQPQQPVVIDFGDKLSFLGYDVRQDDWQRVYLRTYWTRLPGMDNNYALFPFYPDENGAPRTDAQQPDLMFPFWYPTTRWQTDEVIVVDTLPINVGARAKIGVGVFFGATWDTAEHYLEPHTAAPISPDGRWVLVGEIVRAGKNYRIVER